MTSKSPLASQPSHQGQPGPRYSAVDGGADAEAQRINLSWLIKLRWGAIGGQTVTVVAVDRLLHIPLPLWSLFAIIGVELLSNVGLARWARSQPVVPESTLARVMAADVVLFTALLWQTGGPSNPFSFLYLVHIALATVVLRMRWAWGLVGLSFACFGALFIEQRWPGLGAHIHALHHAAGSMNMHLQGMWVAFGVAAAFIVYFLSRVRQDLAAREHELTRARALAARSEKLASLATLAAGAAHELATPLATIAVVAKELERELEAGAGGPQKSADARMIREVVVRCQQILMRMAADAGQSAGEGFSELTLDELLGAALDALPNRDRVALAIDSASSDHRLLLPKHAATQALRGVIANAQQATADGGEVAVSASVSPSGCRIEVRDSGPGMSPEVLARAGEPFFTTKEPGRGMGLGLFVTQAVVERLGGTLELHSTPGAGTTALLTLPRGGARDNLPHREARRTMES
ncbi:MAG: ATP-binding protein [Polyangiales bacterium]